MKISLIPVWLSAVLAIIATPAAAQIGIPGIGGKASGCTDMELKKQIACPDSVLMDFEGVLVVQGLYGRGDYKGLDELFEKWSKGADRFPDGRWKLAMFVEGMSRQFEVWKTWGDDQKKIQAWQKQFPDSFAAKYVEAIYWRNYAWFARGTGYASSVAPEGWALFRERIGFADKVLESLRPRAAKYPAWYSTAIFNKLDMSDHAAAMAIYKEGVATFPEYHNIYFAMGRSVEPRWGGSPEAFDRFASEAATIAKSFEAEGMYLRLYWTVDFTRGVPFESKLNRQPDWAKLKKGIQLLTAKYPSSTHNMNHFASLACRADDKPLYLDLRRKLGNYADPDKFKTATLEACDLRFGFKGKA